MRAFYTKIGEKRRGISIEQYDCENISTAESDRAQPVRCWIRGREFTIAGLSMEQFSRDISSLTGGIPILTGTDSSITVIHVKFQMVL